jgi:hypothetical protein
MCLHGVSVVRDALARVSSQELRVYLVWVPAMDGDDAAAAADSSASVTDARVTQFWDDGLRLGHRLGEALAIPVRDDVSPGQPLAWDVYLLYPPGAAFGDGAPRPASWMHQLRHLPDGFAPRLGEDRLVQELEALAARR